MMFNKKITGYENENEFYRYFNNKKITAFDIETQEFLERLFGFCLKDEIIKCWKVPGFGKADIRIKIKDNMKNISIKKGIKNEMHTETLKNFIDFLREYNVPDYILNNIKLYIYGDGTNNGTGNNRINVKEYKIENQKSIDEINSYLNNETIIKALINRFIIKGRVSELEVDAIIYGITEDYFFILKDKIEKIVINKKDLYSTALHIGPLTIQSWNRNLKYNEKYEYMRDYIQVKWYNLGDNIIEVMNDIRIYNKSR